MTTVVIPNLWEPEHEVAARLLELAGDNPRDVHALRGEHNAPIAFQVPDDLADQFNAERGDRWPEPDTELVDDDNDPSTPPVRRKRPGPATKE